VQVAIHVRPGSSRAFVGGAYGGALVVRVVEPAERGRATEAALRAVAEALCVPRRSVTLLVGATSRRKTVAVDVAGTDGGAVEDRLASLLEAGAVTRDRPGARHR